MDFAGNCSHADILFAALVIGLKLALTRNLTPIEIGIDCQMIMLSQDHPLYSPILSDCRDLLLRLGIPQLKHSYRETNQVANLFSKEGVQIKKPNSVIKYAVPPLLIKKKVSSRQSRNSFYKN